MLTRKSNRLPHPSRFSTDGNSGCRVPGVLEVFISHLQTVGEAGGPEFLKCLLTFRNCGCPVLALFARAGIPDASSECIFEASTLYRTR
jgi:hypothetical protein